MDSSLRRSENSSLFAAAAAVSNYIITVHTLSKVLKKIKKNIFPKNIDNFILKWYH